MKSFSSSSFHSYRFPDSANPAGDTAINTSGNWLLASNCLAYAVRSCVGATNLLTLMSGYLSVTRLIAASHTCGVKFGVSNVRNEISCAPCPPPLPPPPQYLTRPPPPQGRALASGQRATGPGTSYR